VLPANHYKGRLIAKEIISGDLRVSVFIYAFYAKLRKIGAFLYQFERVEDVEKLELVWELGRAAEVRQVQRHCPNCCRKVNFYDTGKLRHNANGKNIYEYGIYKCGNGHTWNQFIRTYKAMTEQIAQEFAETPGSQPDLIRLADWRGTEVGFLEIHLSQVSGRWRLDKLLAQQIADLSRVQIVKRIEAGLIRINGAAAKPDTILKAGQCILIPLNIKL